MLLCYGLSVRNKTFLVFLVLVLSILSATQSHTSWAVMRSSNIMTEQTSLALSLMRQ